MRTSSAPHPSSASSARPIALHDERLVRKLAILADAAKYDASCASSGTTQRDSLGRSGIGSAGGMGICHSFTPDGRCVSLLKVLLTNYCQYDCLYCINRASSNVPRARFSVEEVVQLTLDFYRRNCIEGLFLSSGIIQSPNYTMEQLVRVAEQLRQVHDFRGYIHLKTIPNADPELLDAAGRFADRLSINIELPTDAALMALAPDKPLRTIEQAMGHTHEQIETHRLMQREYHLGSAHSTHSAPSSRRTQAQALLPPQDSLLTSSSRPPPTSPAVLRVGAGLPARRTRPPRFAPAGQSTQMIIGAEATSDKTILATSAHLYGTHGLRRVYYSAYSPIPDASPHLPTLAPPLLREHRLYQADWLLRFYGFTHDELITGSDGLLRLDMDPKLAWALARREQFPVDLQSAPREWLLRVPGLGTRSVQRILAARRVRTLRQDDLRALKVPLAKVLPFVMLSDHHPGRALDSATLEAQLLRRMDSRLQHTQQQWQALGMQMGAGAAPRTAPLPTQLDLFAAAVPLARMEGPL